MSNATAEVITETLVPCVQGRCISHPSKDCHIIGHFQVELYRNGMLLGRSDGKGRVVQRGFALFAASYDLESAQDLVHRINTNSDGINPVEGLTARVVKAANRRRKS